MSFNGPDNVFELSPTCDNCPISKLKTDHSKAEAQDTVDFLLKMVTNEAYEGFTQGSEGIVDLVLDADVSVPVAASALECAEWHKNGLCSVDLSMEIE